MEPTGNRLFSQSYSWRCNGSFWGLHCRAPCWVAHGEHGILFSLRAKHLVLWTSEELPGHPGKDAENRSVMFYESGLRKCKHVSNHRQHNQSADLFKKVKSVSNKSAVRGRPFAIKLSGDTILNDFVVTLPM